MASESEQGKRDALADIVAEMRTRSREVKEAFGGRPDGVENMLDIWANRIEAAWKREREAVEADALSAGGLINAMRHKPDQNWAETCAKCKDGEIEPRNCEYYGEPNGCNSPTYGEHPPVGNAAAMREALNKVNDAYDMLSRHCVTLEEVRQACREARGIIISALSEPARNCDVGTAEEQAKRFSFFCLRYHGCGKCDLNKGRKDCKFSWAQMPYEAQEGAGNNE